MTVKVLAQSMLTKQWLERSGGLPISDIEITKTLNGPSVIRGVITPERPEIEDIGLEPWATWIHIEDSGQIRASGILQPLVLEGNVIKIEATGASSYANGMPFTDHYEASNVDPWTVVNVIWDHLQSKPEGNIGVTVDPDSTPKRLGTELDNDFNVIPYSLPWWDRVDCGRELSELAAEAPFDWIERDYYNADKSDVEHHIVLGYPRHGTRKFKLYFSDTDNIETVVPLAEPQDWYASEVLVTGSGEGRDMIRGYAGQRFGNRVRRAVVVEDKEIDTTARANARAYEELLRRQFGLVEVAEIEINAKSDSARIGSFQEGDDIAVRASFAYFGYRTIWSRIVSYSYKPATERARLQLAPVNSFRFG